MNVFYVNWQDPQDRRWYTVARLIRFRDVFIFNYTNGSLGSPRFFPFGNLTDQSAIYVSSRLFPIFSNRVMNEKRPEYRRYAEWAGLEFDRADPLLLMARMGGARATDTLQVYPVPTKGDENLYRTTFFSHGISHLSPEVQPHILGLNAGDALFPMLDIQNPFDSRAVALRSADPAIFVGYCPRYLAKDLAELLRLVPKEFVASVRKVNADAPAQFRLLCEVVSPWPALFLPCNDDEHRSVVDFDPSEVASMFLARNPEIHLHLANTKV